MYILFLYMLVSLINYHACTTAAFQVESIANSVSARLSLERLSHGVCKLK